MTIIKRILFGMDEILSVRLGCRKCKASLNVPFGENEYVPEVCPYCKETWFKNGSNDFNALHWLIQGITVLNGRSSEANCQIEMEMKQPDS